MRALIALPVLALLPLTAAPSAAAGQDTFNCPVQGDPASLAERPSPLDSVSVQVGDATVKVCYGAPSSRGRTMIGGENVPYGELWRTGANEPTVIHLPFAAEVAGIRVEPGTYALYTMPGEDEWSVFLNPGIDRWGIPISDEVRANEVGEGTVPQETTDEHVETLTLTFENASAEGADLILEWETSRIRIPVRRVGG